MNRTLLLLLSMSALPSCSPGHFGTPAPVTSSSPPDAGDAAPLVATTPPPVACDSLKITTLTDVETKFLGPRCGTVPPGVVGANCHSTEFPPKGLDAPGTIRGTLVDQPSVSCKMDKYINRADITRSFILAKVLAPTDMVDCPSGGPAGAGLFRMPDQAVNPKPALLSSDERGCFMWYVSELAKQP
jgi:hypothetical protein